MVALTQNLRGILLYHDVEDKNWGIGIHPTMITNLQRRCAMIHRSDDHGPSDPCLWAKIDDPYQSGEQKFEATKNGGEPCGDLLWDMRHAMNGDGFWDESQRAFFFQLPLFSLS